MTQLDTTLRATAVSLLVKFGKSLTITKVTTGSYDTATGSAATTETAETAKGFIEVYTAGEINISGGLVKRGDKQITFAAADISAPSTGDRVTIDSLDWTIKAVEELWSGEQIAAYLVQVRS